MKNVVSMGTAPPLVSFQKASFIDREQIIFSDLSWEIQIGDSWTILGKNGSGKLNLLRCLEQKLSCCSGKASWKFPCEKYESRVVCVYPDSHRLITRGNNFPQARWESMFRDDLERVEEYLISQAREGSSIDEIVKLLEIEKLKSRKLISLSNGEGRKLSIASAMLKKPSLLVIVNHF